MAHPDAIPVRMTKNCEKKLNKNRKRHDPALLRDIMGVIESLKTDQTIGRVMTGDLKGWRKVSIRHVYRLVYEVKERPHPCVVVQAIDHRRDVYKNLAILKKDLEEQSKHGV